MPELEVPVTPKKETAAHPSIEQRLDDLEVLIRQNIQWSQILNKDIKRVRRHQALATFAGWFKFVIFITPFILGAIFLPPYIRQAQNFYLENVQKPQQKIEKNLNNFMNLLPKNIPTTTR